MNLLRVVMLVIALMLPCLARADEQGERNDVRQLTLDALQAKDFSALEALHGRFSTDDAYTISGYPKLQIFFESVVELPRGAEEKVASYLDDRDAMTLKWVNKNPESPLAIAFHAKSLLAHGYFFRGYDNGSNVSSSNMAKFKEFAGVAADFLHAHQAIGARDVAWYATTADVARALAWPADALVKVAYEALAKFPNDQSVPRSVIMSLLPKMAWECTNARRVHQSRVTRDAIAARAGDVQPAIHRRDGQPVSDEAV